MKRGVPSIPRQPLGAGTGAPPELNGYLLAAAATSTFDPEHLKPFGQTGDRDTLVALLQLCEPVFGRTVPAGRWRLPDSLRRTLLSSLQHAGELRYLVRLNGDADDLEQQALRRYVERTAPPLPNQTLAELRASAQAVAWLEGIVEDLPSVNEITSRIDLLELLAPLRRLVGERFAGRQDVLAKLVEHVGVLPPASRSMAIRRRVRRALSFRESPPLCLWGPGGVGKSTALAKFILDHVDRADGALAFVFADLDRPGLSVFEPLTLLHEGARQLGLQFPDVAAQTELLLESWADAMSSPDLANARRATANLPEALEEARAPQAASARHHFYSQFAELVMQVASDRPLLFVIDTFEMAQRRGEEVIADIWAFLEDLQRQIPTMRVVIAGRKSLEQDGYRVKSIALAEFDPSSAAAFLSGAVGGYISPEDPALRRVIGIVGRSPLNLQLAADLLRREGIDALRRRDSYLFFRRLHEGQLQGVLYRRILEHLEDPDVRKLSFPGLEVRRITPGVIRHVLAGVCGVDVPDDRRAEELYDSARREVTLLEDRDGALLHRADVRRQMLPSLRRAEPRRTVQVDEAAVAYYSAFDQADVVARAEEVYHRLMLEHPSKVLDERWMPGISHYLWSALEEVPSTSAVYLAGQMGVSLPHEITRLAELTAWERHAEQKAGRLLARERPEAALEVLQERPQRTPGSALLPIEAQALEQLGRVLEAAEVLRRAVQENAELGRDRNFVRVGYSLAALEHQLGNDQAALSLLDECRRLTSELHDELESLRVEALAARLELGSGGEQLGRERLSAVVEATPDKVLREDRNLLAEVAAAVGDDRPSVLVDALAFVGLRPLTPGQRQQLASGLAQWDRQLDGRLSALVMQPADRVHGDSAETRWEEWLASSSPAAVAAGIRTALASLPTSRVVTALLSRLYQVWLDSSKRS